MFRLWSVEQKLCSKSVVHTEAAFKAASGSMYLLSLGQSYARCNHTGHSSHQGPVGGIEGGQVVLTHIGLPRARNGDELVLMHLKQVFCRLIKSHSREKNSTIKLDFDHVHFLEHDK